jgi:hypothetical protein
MELNMPEMKSSITNRRFQGQPMRDIEVPDETGYQPPAPTGGGQFAPSVAHRYGKPMSEQDIMEFNARMQANQDPDFNLSDVERDMKRMRQEKMQSHQMLNDGARKRIEMLIGMTRSTRSVDIEGNVYGLQTLKGREMREAMMAVSEFDATVQFPFEMRRQLLARALTQVAGVPIDNFVGSNTLESKLEFIDQLDDILLNRLMEEYSALNQEAKSKYTMQKPEDVKEVAEDLKK